MEMAVSMSEKELTSRIAHRSIASRLAFPRVYTFDTAPVSLVELQLRIGAIPFSRLRIAQR